MNFYSQALPKPIEKMSFFDTTQKERSLEFAILKVNLLLQLKKSFLLIA
jgi:hypothetical protein